MRRCLQLAMLGEAHVAPNPLVGAVLCYEDRIIGEGYHAYFGGPHAEVACIRSVKEADRDKIPFSKLFVSLEPCNHVGKTGACTELIIQEKIPEVWIACTDPFEKVNGWGIARLKEAGIKVICGLLEDEAQAINHRFFTFHQQHRPYIMLKWAESADHFIGAESRIKISHPFTDRLTHRWRGSEAAIMVGTQTAMKDNPQLDTRFWPGKNPVRVLLDRKASLPVDFALMNQQAPTLIFTEEESRVSKNLEWIKVNFDEQLVPRILNILHQKGISSLIVEGGAKLLQSFIDAGIWDEARVISNPLLRINEGIAAPVLKDAICAGKQLLPQDQITYYKPMKSPISFEN